MEGKTIPLYPFICPNCGHEFDELMSMSEYDEFVEVPCAECGHTCTKKHRRITAASVTRASYVDGTKRPGFAERREALKLRKASYDMKPEDRKEVRKTIKEIERKM